jgi:hypothetical protein
VDRQREVAVALVDVEVLAQVDGGIDRGVGAAVDVEREQHDLLVAGRLRRGGRLRRDGDVVDPVDLASGLVDRGAQRRSVLLAVVEDQDQRLGLHAGEALERVRDGERPGARDLEPACGEVLGLLCREWHRRQEQHDPHAQNESSAVRDESLEPVHGCPHDGRNI